MPSKKKKYNARFPAGRIKKIMQTDEEVGKVAQAVPVIISRTLELFVESLLVKSMQITQARCAKTLTPSHMKQCILSESRFDFLKDLVKNIPDPSAQEDNENNAQDGVDYSFGKSSESTKPNQEERKSEASASYYTEQGTSSTAQRMPVIQYGPKVAHVEKPKFNFSIENLIKQETTNKTNLLDLSQVPATSAPSSSQILIPNLVPSAVNKSTVPDSTLQPQQNQTPLHDNVPPLIPITQNIVHGPNSGDNNLYIDEDYDN